MADHRHRHEFLSQRVTDSVCPDCGAPVIQFVETGFTYRVDASQAPITRTPVEHARAGRQVWRLNLATGRWRYNPSSPRGENPVHLVHECPTPGHP